MCRIPIVANCLGSEGYTNWNTVYCGQIVVYNASYKAGTNWTVLGMYADYLTKCLGTTN